MDVEGLYLDDPVAQAVPEPTARAGLWATIARVSFEEKSEREENGHPFSINFS
jgi:hypothetical protein